MTASIRRMVLTAAVTTWAAVAVAGMSVLMASTRAPNDSALSQSRWPAGLAIKHVDNGPTVVVCLHPRCPCSDATLDSLISILGTSTNANVYVLFTIPEHASKQWTDTELIAKAKKVDGLNIVMDVGGRQSSMLGARTSGQAFLYDSAGRLAFSGGLTPGRGELGDTPGATKLSAALADHPINPETLITPVFGCALVHPFISEAVQ